MANKIVVYCMVYPQFLGKHYIEKYAEIIQIVAKVKILPETWYAE